MACLDGSDAGGAWGPDSADVEDGGMEPDPGALTGGDAFVRGAMCADADGSMDDQGC